MTRFRRARWGARGEFAFARRILREIIQITTHDLRI
jgi:hypothetical protein